LESTGTNHRQGKTAGAAADHRRPTALNLATALAEAGILDNYQVELIGAKLPAIKKAKIAIYSNKR